jgi:putative alpha-1,2-mannosidase
MSSEWARNHKVYYAVRFSHPIAQTHGENPKVAFAFGDVKEVEARVALSYNSVEAALANLEAEGGKKFADVLASAKGKWNSQLSTIDFKGLDSTIDTIFYTSLYHTAFAPQLFSDVEQADEYTIFSTWDTYRAVHPLYTIIDPKAGDYVNSMLIFPRQPDVFLYGLWQDLRQTVWWEYTQFQSSLTQLSRVLQE